jgi:hypothetical protein
MRSTRINHLIKKGLSSLRTSSLSKKEQKRFSDIYKTVYRHARRKGQTHKQALNYCWNVYADQAPSQAKSIIKHIVSEQMRIDRKQIRKMIMEALEGEVVNLADYRPSDEPVVADPEMSETLTYDSFLSEMHSQIHDFVEDNFESLSPEQQVFLEEMLDTVEDELGIAEEDEEGFDFGDEDEVEEED